MRASPLSVSDLNEYVRRSLAGDPMLQDIQIHGEISNFKRYPSGHLYFSLKDSESRIACVMFRQYAQMLKVVPQDGMQVVLGGCAGLYPASGSYQFYSETMAAQGTGALYEQFLKTRDRLQKEGLFDAALKKPLPLLPRGVGIVTSGGGAVLHDIINVTRRRFPEMPLYLRACQVQGVGAAEDLARGLKELSALPEVDVLIIGRGGGSLEDLWAFNEEVLVRAIAACEKPVISAVGHETDVTLADFAADVRAPTPSAAAELAVPVKAELIGRVSGLLDKLTARAVQNLEAKRTALQDAVSVLKLLNPAQRVLLIQAKQVMVLQKLRAVMQERFQELKTRAQSAAERFELSGPRQTLRRGYIIALHEGRPVLEAKNAPARMELMFKDGKVDVQTLFIKLDDREEHNGKAEK